MAREENIIREIQDISARIRRIEAVRQPVGADIVQIVTSGLTTASSGSVASGSRAVFTITVTPSNQKLTLWDILFSIYVDTNSNSAYLYPSGASLSAGQKNLDLQWAVDYSLSSDATGQRVAKITVVNNDSSAHTYYLHQKFYGIKQTI